MKRDWLAEAGGLSRSFRHIPNMESIKDLMDLIATRIECADAPADFKPKHGWHTIRVGAAQLGDQEVDPATLRVWMRLFDSYIDAHREYGILLWKEVPNFNRKSRELTASFTVAPRPRKEPE